MIDNIKTSLKSLELLDLQIKKETDLFFQNIENSNISVLQKLDFINSRDFEPYPWVVHFFVDWYNDFSAQLRKNNENRYIPIYETPITYCDSRHEKVTVESIMECILDSIHENEYCEEEANLVLQKEFVLFKSNDIEYKRTVEEILEKILNWCIKNKTNSFIYDW